VSLRVLLPIGAMFAFLASIMAFLITYNEYAKHYRDTWEAVRTSLQTALVTFLVFCALSLVAGLVLDYVLGARS
jgi:hypothetical protein